MVNVGGRSGMAMCENFSGCWILDWNSVACGLDIGSRAEEGLAN